MRLRKVLVTVLSPVLLLVGVTLAATPASATTTCPKANVRVYWSAPDMTEKGDPLAAYCSYGKWHYLTTQKSAGKYGTLVPYADGYLHRRYVPKNETFIASASRTLYCDSGGCVVKGFSGSRVAMVIRDRWGDRLDLATATAMYHRTGLHQ